MAAALFREAVASAFRRHVFNRAEFLNVLQQLDNFYRSPDGLLRPGLSINGGPDFGLRLGVRRLPERTSGGGSSAVAWTQCERHPSGSTNGGAAQPD
jgi:hypothetical protein